MSPSAWQWATCSCACGRASGRWLFVTHDLEEAIALADRVVIMSAGPGARVIGDHAIDLERSRDAAEARLLPRFHRLHQAIWSQLRAEVLKAYGGDAA
jgi:NitT/TauT family transport system ATP-binding protein